MNRAVCQAKNGNAAAPTFRRSFPRMFSSSAVGFPSRLVCSDPPDLAGDPRSILNSPKRAVYWLADEGVPVRPPSRPRDSADRWTTGRVLCNLLVITVVLLVERWRNYAPASRG